MSEHELILIAVMLGSFIAFAACARSLRQVNDAHADMIRRHARWREESRRQFDSDMAAIERLLDKAKQVQK